MWHYAPRRLHVALVPLPLTIHATSSPVPPDVGHGYCAIDATEDRTDLTRYVDPTKRNKTCLHVVPIAWSDVVGA